MRMYTHTANSIDEIKRFIIEHGIPDDYVVSIDKSSGGQYVLSYLSK